MLHATLATLLLTAGLVAPTPDPPLLPRSTASTGPVTTSPPPPSTATTPADESARSAAARAHYAARRYREAAQVYEQLWRDTQAPKYRFNAGMARAAGEHDGAAIVHWQAYLAAAPTIAPAERSMLETEIAAAKRRTLAIQLKIQGPLAPATLTLRAPEGAPQGPRDPIDLMPATAIDLSLEAGAWTATLIRPGRPDAVAEFRVAPDAATTITLGADTPAPVVTPPPTPVANKPTEPGTLTLTFAPARAVTRGITLDLEGPTPTKRHVREPALSLQLQPGTWIVQASAPHRTPALSIVQLGPGDTTRLQLRLPRSRDGKLRLGLGLGLGGAGLVFVTAGAVVAARAPHGDLPCTDIATCSATASAVLDRSIGFSLIGTGLGAAVPALTVGLGPERPPAIINRALLVEAGVGGLALIGGLAWYATEASKTTALDHIAREHAGATVLGLGGGMLGSAAISLVARRLTRRPVAVTPTFTSHTRGLSLQARF